MCHTQRLKASWQKKRLYSRLCTLERKLDSMKDPNAKIQNEFMRRLEGLPPKAREAAQHNFNAAKRKILEAGFSPGIS